MRAGLNGTNGHARNGTNGHGPVNRLADLTVTLTGDATVNVRPDGAGPVSGPAAGAPGGKAPAEERDAGGRFKKGNRAAKGNPHYRRMAELRTALLDAVGPDDVAAIARQLVSQARAGDLGAARLLFAYCLGRAPEAANPDLADQDEWDLLTTSPTGADFLKLLTEALPADVCSSLVRSFLLRNVEALGERMDAQQQTRRAAGREAAGK